MAILQVDSNGEAPKNAKIGDIVVTNGGSYEVVDVTGMNADQIQAAGIGYNPSSKLYSKKVSSITTKDLALQNYNTANQWLQQANTQAKQQLTSDYNTNLSNAMQSYNTNLSGLKQQANSVNQNYYDSVRQAKTDAYNAGKASMAGAVNRGMTNSSQSQAAANSLLYSVGTTMADLNSERNTLLNDIYTNINTLTQNYNIHLDELEKNKLAEELNSLSNNQLSYLVQIMAIDEYNADAYNNYRNQQMQMEWQSAENQKDRDHDIYMFGLQNKGNGGNGGNSGNNVSNGISSGGYNQAQATRLIDKALANGTITENEAKVLAGLMEDADVGLISYDAVVQQLNQYANTQKGTSSASGMLDRIVYGGGRNPYAWISGAVPASSVNQNSQYNGSRLEDLLYPNRTNPLITVGR